MMQTDQCTCEGRAPLKKEAVSIVGVNGCYDIIGDSKFQSFIKLK